MKRNDIRIEKNNLRTRYKDLKSSLSTDEKRTRDDSIFSRLTTFPPFADADTILCFVSTAKEIDTHRIIKHCFDNNKTIAVPKCIDKNGNMKFFIINSFSDLHSSTFSLLEPDVNRCKPLPQSALLDKDTLCIVPGFAFDRAGYRIGFGKGYYDRFLKVFNGVKVGICYNQCIINRVPNGRYDIASDYIVTEKYIITCSSANARNFTNKNTFSGTGKHSNSKAKRF